MLINQGYHLMDFWQDLFGLPETLYADIPFGKYNDFDVDDEATLVMDYPGRMTGTFIMSTGEGVPTERLDIIGTKGRILMDAATVSVTSSTRTLRSTRGKLRSLPHRNLARLRKSTSLRALTAPIRSCCRTSLTLF